MACSFALFYNSLHQGGVMLMIFADRPCTRNKLLLSLPKTASRTEPKQENKRLFAPRPLSFWGAGNYCDGPVPQVLVVSTRV